MIEFVSTVIALIGVGNFPSHFDEGQRALGTQIIEHAHTLNEDPYLLMAIAWQESILKKGRTSHTGDVGIFQINWKFWGRRVWKYNSYEQFVIDMDNPEHATYAAVMVQREMRLYKTCKGINLHACYNGGPAWMKSKNIKKIMEYARRGHRHQERFKRYKRWSKSKK